MVCSLPPFLTGEVPCGRRPENPHPPGHAQTALPDTAHVVCEASEEATQLRHEPRSNPGAEYDAEESVVIDTHAPGDPLFFDTDFSLNQPGAKIALKLYVVLTMGNEAGSATVTVQRPF